MRLATRVALAAASLAAGASHAQVVLADGNSTVTFAAQPGGGPVQVGWTVDGRNHLFSQAFLIAFGGTPTLLNTYTTATRLSDTTGDGLEDVLYATYANVGGLVVDTRFSLDGGLAGSGASDLAEQIEISNSSGRTISFRFFQYVDFDLLGTARDDSVAITGGNTARQLDGGFAVAESAVVPLPTFFQAGTVADVTAGLNHAQLDNTLAAGSGNLAWAFQWNITLGHGQSILISKDKLLIPAPGPLAVLAAGALAATRRRRA